GCCFAFPAFPLAKGRDRSLCGSAILLDSNQVIESRVLTSAAGHERHRRWEQLEIRRISAL
ncbi:MAG: hypothetical protein KC457_29725, partial [Myxococcales bacterium]|nr:hypothetical protein [Myxococcales bacterium]